MKKVKTDMIELSKLKFVQNSRLRATADVSDLMEDFKIPGQLQPIGVRCSDNAIIYGNRRVSAARKMEWKEIKADFFDDVDDNELLVMNVVENIKRKNIGSVEIGRMCNLLKKNGLSSKEVAERIGIKPTRVESCLACYRNVSGTDFEELISYGSRGGESFGTIPESAIWNIYHLNRWKKLTNDDWKRILEAVKEGTLPTQKIRAFGRLLSSEKNITIAKALKLMEEATMVYVDFVFDKSRLSEEMRKKKIESPREFVKNLIREKYSDLLF